MIIAVFSITIELHDLGWSCIATLRTRSQNGVVTLISDLADGVSSDTTSMPGLTTVFNASQYCNTIMSAPAYHNLSLFAVSRSLGVQPWAPEPPVVGWTLTGDASPASPIVA